MEIHQLEYVLAVATYNSFTRAAESQNVSQSSLSQQIRKLEDELGVNLFSRTTRSVQLTPAGAEFITYAKRILSEIDKARQSILEYTSYERGHLTLGVMPVIGYYNLTPMLSYFQRNFPGVKLNLLEAECKDLLELLHSAKIDAAIVSINKPDTHIQFYHLRKDHMVLVTNKHHPFASRLSVELKELGNEKLITPPINSGHYQDFFNACLSIGFQPKPLMHCSQVATILDLVREDLGITVLASCVAAGVDSPSLATISLKPTIKRKVSLAIRKSDTSLPIIKVFVKFVHQWIHTLDIYKNKFNGN